MFSLAGIPPFAGFFGKFYIFISALQADLIYLAILGVIASVISAFYYLRVIKIIYFENSEFDHQIILSKSSLFILIFSISFISFFILYPSLLVNIAIFISNSFF